MARRTLVYGPVASRRYGLSLGIDPLPAKTCCYDCVYCQQGRTTRPSAKRRDLVPLDDVLHDVREALERGPAPRVLTLAGSGEPTLYRPLGDLVAGLRSVSRAGIVLLTNGALMSDPDVRDAACAADVVCPSLDAADADTFRRINRPHPDIDFDRMVQGLQALRRSFSGRYDLEVFLARGINDGPDHLQRLARLARSIAPDAIQLNTAVRPPPGRMGLALTLDEMRRAAAIFGPTAEVIAGFEQGSPPRPAARKRDLLEVLERRPCTPAELALALGMDAGQVARMLDELESAGQVVEAGDEGYWRAAKG